MYEQILDMIEKSKLGINEIARGSGVGSRWLRMIVNNEIKEPGITKLEKVRDFLQAK